MRASITIFCVALTVLLSCIDDLDSKRSVKVKKPKAINWNDPYYATKFDPCKKQRIFNPVELVKAQSWAAWAFRKCAARIIVEYSAKYRFPAWGEYLRMYLE